MEFLQEWTVPALVIALGYVVLGLTGFASSLIAVPLLSWRWPLEQVVPLALMLDCSASLLMGGLNLRQVQWGELRHLAPGMLLGGALALVLTARLDPLLPLLLLGTYVAWVGWRVLRDRPSAGQGLKALPASLGWVYGTTLGLVTLSFGTGGPLVVAWLARRGLGAHTVRASVPVIYTLATLAVLLLLAGAGRLADPLLWQRLLVLLPVAVLGTLAGHAWVRHVPAAVLRRLICLLLMASGGMLVLRSLLQAG